VDFGANGFDSFMGDIYSFDFTPTKIGVYTFGAGTTHRTEYGAGDDIDNLTLTSSVTINVVAAAPEPASVTLLTLGAAGLAGYCWRRRR
jgi:hypothetical protein